VTDDDFSWLICRMVFVIEDKGRYVIKDGTGFIEADPMLAKIDSGFASIPFKVYTHLAHLNKYKLTESLVLLFPRFVQKVARRHNGNATKRGGILSFV
jgi:hypothetical protein